MTSMTQRERRIGEDDEETVSTPGHRQQKKTVDRLEMKLEGMKLVIVHSYLLATVFIPQECGYVNYKKRKKTQENP